MTTSEKFLGMLTERAVSERQALEIMEIAKTKLAAATEYNFTWDRPASEYPDNLYSIVFDSYIKPSAIEWIDKNLPQAFWRMLFI